MTRVRILCSGMGTLLAAATFVLAPADDAQAQGISIGPNGMSLGGYYIPFNDNRGYDNRRYDDGRYDDDRFDNRRYDNRGGYGPGGYYDRVYGRSGAYWSPGMYWAPNDYWYGDRDWARYDNGGVRNWDNSTESLLPRRFGLGRDTQANVPPLPQLEELQRMNWTHLRRVLAYGAKQLEQGLQRLETGQKWVTYLRIDSIQAVAANQENVPPTSEEADELLSILQKFNQTADDEQFAAIHEQWGFKTVQLALAEFLENPAVRYRQQLVVNSADLDRALDRFGTGAGWQQHLSLPADLFVDPEDIQAAKSPPDPEALRKALLKYDEVAKNPAYRVIGDLPAFQATHASLARYLGRELPAENEPHTADHTPEPPADPSLNEPAPVRVTPQADPFSAEPNESEAAPATNSVLKPKTPPRQVEELLPPANDDAPKTGPAVREKE